MSDVPIDSETFLARDMFIGYWGVVQASILARADVCGFKSAQQELVEQRVREHDAFVGHLNAATTLDRALLAIVAADGGLALGGERSAWLEVSLHLGRQVGPGHSDDADFEADLLRAVRVATASFVAAFVAAQYAFNEENASPPADLRSALRALADCIRPAARCADLVERAYDDWLDEGLESQTPGSVPSYVAWLARQQW